MPKRLIEIANISTPKLREHSVCDADQRTCSVDVKIV